MATVDSKILPKIWKCRACHGEQTTCEGRWHQFLHNVAYQDNTESMKKKTRPLGQDLKEPRIAHPIQHADQLVCL